MSVIPNRTKDQYEWVDASQSSQVIGVTGGVGDLMKRLIIIPNTTGAGTVTLQDGSNTAMDIHKGGGTLVDLKPFVVEIQARSAAGAWKVTTGANVTVIAVGDFTV